MTPVSPDTTDAVRGERAASGAWYRRILAEPFVGFALAACAIFLLHGAIRPADQVTITLNAGSLELAVQNRAALLSRDLTRQERQTVINTLADQEILVREAVDRGLHLLDPATRKRLVDQMHFLMASEAPEPTRADLEQLQAENPKRYRTPRSVSFTHVFFETDKAAALRLLGELDAGGQPAPDAGDRFWLGSNMEGYTVSQLLTVLGYDFVTALPDLPVGKWSGPVQSARGWHLVHLTGFNDPQPLPPDELQRRLRSDWNDRHRDITYDDQLDVMRARYRIEWPESRELTGVGEAVSLAPTSRTGG